MEEVVENPTLICESFLADMEATDPNENAIVEQLNAYAFSTEYEWQRSCVPAIDFLNNIQSNFHVCYDKIPIGEPIQTIKKKGCEIFQTCSKKGLWTKEGRPIRREYEKPIPLIRENFYDESEILTRELEKPEWFCKNK